MVIKAQTWWVLTEIRLNGSVVFKVPPPYGEGQEAKGCIFGRNITGYFLQG